MPITVIGTSELVAKLDKLSKLVTTAEARASFREGAKIIALRQRQLAPRGSTQDGDKNPGLLRRSIVWFLGRKQARREPISYARVNILSGRNRAPHGHLVSFGTATRTAGGKVMRFRAVGKWRAARSVRAMTPNDYFEQGVREASSAALNHIVSSLQRKAEGLK